VPARHALRREERRRHRIQRLVDDDDDFDALLASILPLDGAGLVGSAAGDHSSGFDPADAWARCWLRAPSRLRPD